MTKNELFGICQSIRDLGETLLPGGDVIMGKDEIKVHRAILKCYDTVFNMACNAKEA